MKNELISVLNGNREQWLTAIAVVWTLVTVGPAISSIAVAAIVNIVVVTTLTAAIVANATATTIAVIDAIVIAAT